MNAQLKAKRNDGSKKSLFSLGKRKLGTCGKRAILGLWLTKPEKWGRGLKAHGSPDMTYSDRNVREGPNAILGGGPVMSKVIKAEQRLGDRTT